MDAKHSHTLLFTVTNCLSQLPVVTHLPQLSNVCMCLGHSCHSILFPYTNNRQKAEDDIKVAKNEADMADAKSRKAFYKLFGNSVSGKTFQNDLKFHDTTFVRNKQQHS